MTSTTAFDLKTAPFAFWSWWTGELSDLLPAPFRGNRQLKKPYLILEIGSEESRLRACTRRQDTELGRSAEIVSDALTRLGDRRFRNWPLVVRLAPPLGLTKPVDLPKVPEQDLASLLGYEFDRLTPFKAEDAFYAWRVIGENKEERRMQVWLEIAPRAVVAPILDALEKHGRPPTRLELQADGDRPALDLLASSSTEPKPKTRPSLLPALALGLAIIAGALPLRQQAVMIEQLQSEVERARKKAEESVALREQLARHAAERAFLVNERDQQRTVTEVMRALTQLTPDHAHITRLDIRDAQITFVGHADKASDLIGLLESSPLFAVPRFQSPVTFDPRTKKERFQITAQITGANS
jgi:general secretion pathway protein L